jgi:ATP-dependent helicase/nuclease subunit A
MTGPVSAREAARRDQAAAADPALLGCWVDASAGSGKTKVLTDRVLRLLLREGQQAGRILCLTFTRAAAAEMRTRIAQRLGEWAVAEDAALARALAELGAPTDPATLRRARALFAEVLELPGGMRITTIHSFCQSLLHAFPLEAGLAPQFRVLEEADAAALHAEAREAVLAGQAPEAALALLAGLVDAGSFAEAVGRLLTGRNRERLAECLRHSNGVAGLRLRLAALLDLDAETDEQDLLARACTIPDPVLQAVAALANHRHKRGRDLAPKMQAWLALDPAARAGCWEDWCGHVFNTKGQLRDVLAELPAFVAEAARIEALQERLAACRQLEATMALLELANPILEHVEARKRGAGLLGYDDLIEIASRVLRDPGSAWVLFKLDGGLDHVLLDEAQDSNPAQWKIAWALSEEFFAGLGADRREPSSAVPPQPRSVFAVGDVKQAIYGFQGSDARGFGSWEQRFRARVEALAPQGFRRIPLTTSFRSTTPVLALVDAVFRDGPARAGVVEDGAVLRHRADREGQAGLVELWPMLRVDETPKAEEWLSPEEPAEAADASAQMAEALAARIAAMIREERLPARDRAIHAGDILVLVRRLANVPLVPRLVRALKRRGVAVAGISRLKLVEHIAVMDLLALCDVLLLPDDDLQLAALLKSPLCGLDEDALFELAHGRPGSLWSRLLAYRGAATPLGRAADWIGRLAERLDLLSPHALLAEALGQAGEGFATTGRARLLARLGPDAAEPLDEMLNAALAYERAHPPALQGFVHWLRAGGAEVKREAEGGADAVRIMTVHNAKGLQAPIVILPDVGGGSGDDKLRWTEAEERSTPLPLWAPRKEYRSGAFQSLAAADTATRQQEENRLLYVALTRAEDRLLVCGWREEPQSWYAHVAAGFQRLAGAEAVPFDPAAFDAPAGCRFEGTAWRFACAQTAEARVEAGAPEADGATLPGWATRPAPPESAEAAIAPSAVPGEAETPVAAPQGADDPMGRRFRRGRLVHALLQHLPERPAGERAAVARAFLGRPGQGLPDAEREEIQAEVLALLEVPEIAAAFGSDSLAEAPIAGRVGGLLIAGQVDRLLVTPDRVLVLDYKTNRPPPRAVAAVAPLYLRQMAAYRAVLRLAFPGRAVDCALVWTYGATVMPLPGELLDRHAPAG